MQANLFWSLVEQKRVSLIAEHQARLARYLASQDPAHLEGQPKDGKSIFMVSREVPGVSPAGAVVEMNFRLAAIRSVESSHDVASPTQIARFLERQKENLRIVEALTPREHRINNVRVQR